MSSSNKLFQHIYGTIQADLFNQVLSAEEKLLSMYQRSYETIIADLEELYRKYSVHGVLTHAQMSKFNRLVNLEKQLSEKLLPEFRKKDAYLKKFSSVMYEESFYQHAYALDMAGGAALKWGIFREEDIEAITLSPLSKLSDSKMLSSQRVKDVYAIRKEITLGMVRGDAYPAMAQRIQQVLGLRDSKGKLKAGNRGLMYQVMRVARTEGQRAAVAGQQRAYEKAHEQGVKLDQVWDAALDGRTRAEHGALDGKKQQEKGWYVPSIGWVAGPLQSGVASFDIHCRCRVRGQIKNYTPKVRGVKGSGQQPWTDYESWKKVVKDKGSAKGIGKPPKIADIPIGFSGAEQFGKRLQAAEGKLGGSTGAKLFRDDEGQEWIVKTYKGSTAKVQNEFVANQVYQKAGIQVAETRLAQINGELGIASKRLPNTYSVAGWKSLEWMNKAQRVKSGFVVDAWLANWDVAGLDLDNLMWKEGKMSTITRIDQGGALFYRAQGAKKGSAFGKKVLELNTLRDSKKNYAAASVFKDISDKDIAGQIRTLRNRLKNEDMYGILQVAGLQKDAVDEYYDLLTSRFDYLRNWEKAYRASVHTSKKVTTAQSTIIGRSPEEVTRLTHEAWEKCSKAEKWAVEEYTGAGFRRINKAALEGKNYKELDAALDKLPQYEGVVGRGMRNLKKIHEQWQNWKSGKWAYVQWDAYSSASITPGRNFSTQGGFLAVIKTKGKNRAGYINGKSVFKSEDEYLFGTKAKFRVIGYAESPDGKKRTLLLEEMDDIPDNQEPPEKMEYEEIMSLWKKSRER